MPHSTLRTSSLSIVLLSALARASVWTGINTNSDPWNVEYNTSFTVGPDGPWNVAVIHVDYADQLVPMFPSLAEKTLVISAAACQAQTANCPLPLPALWQKGGAQSLFAWQNSNPYNGSTWDSTVSEPLNVTGQVHDIGNRVTLQSPSGQGFLDLHGMSASENMTVNYPDSRFSYTMDVGQLSMYGGSSNWSWTSTNGSSITWNRTLPDAYTAGYIPSVSYGLHIGSAEPNVSGSLYWGGYDSSRCLSSPIVSNNQLVELVDVSIGVDSGASPFPNSPTGQIHGLLQVNGAQINNVSAMPNPGVPYMYLPGSTCDAIAAHLPVTFNPFMGLYFWNTSQQSYREIVKSPSYLNFTFVRNASDPSFYRESIRVPFALLNLTMQQPLVPSAASYFPCKPYNPADGSTYHLGRAFLQAAFLAQNWQTSKLWLAQAPGPDTPLVNVKRVAATDDFLTPMTNAPQLFDTWTMLKPLRSSVSNPTNSTTPTDPSASTSTGLSAGAKAGTAVGVVAGVVALAALALFALRRRKHRRRAATALRAELDGQTAAYEKDDAGATYEADAGAAMAPRDVKHAPLSEMGGPAPAGAAEMEARAPVGELQGSDGFGLAGRDGDGVRHEL
ncbi:hypothetical protein B0A49_00929 [Cryomyces minteri]|uniref:Peptidase A1 domain-containing protein n=1 Tax=Cryomyces minteri TaxID=331657 RepID=A0A4U0XMM2_9PEZI|nr:hypothetical protein B0A49_00929 [Cryomyces minteri]